MPDGHVVYNHVSRLKISQGKQALGSYEMGTPKKVADKLSHDSDT